MLRKLLATLIAAHGLAHTLGFVVAWKLSQFEGMPYTTSLLDGQVGVGDVGIRIVGLLWLLAAVAFIGAAVRVARRAPAAIAMLAWASGFSALLCLTQVGEAQIGLLIDGALLLALAAGALARRHGGHGGAFAGGAR